MIPKQERHSFCIRKENTRTHFITKRIQPIEDTRTPSLVDGSFAKEFLHEEVKLEENEFMVFSSLSQTKKCLSNKCSILFPVLNKQRN